jgi:hypothetical protein
VEVNKAAAEVGKSNVDMLDKTYDLLKQEAGTVVSVLKPRLVLG